MKKLLVCIFILLSSISYSQHVFKPSIGIFDEVINKYHNEQKDRYYGAYFKLDHTLRHENFQWIGSIFMASFDIENELVVSYGIVLNYSFFNNFAKMQIVFPKVNLAIDGNPYTGYNTPFGYQLYLFKGKYKLDIQQMFFRDGIATRFGLCYHFIN